MAKPQDMRILIVVLMFGVSITVGGFHSLSRGYFEIRGGESSISVGGNQIWSSSQGSGRVTGRIGAGHVLYWPLCVAWIALGLSMVTLAVLSFISYNVTYSNLCSISLLAVLLLAVVTVATGLWSGP